MSGRANLRRATDHRATVRSGYCPIGLLSCRVNLSWATITRANVRSGYCLVGLLSGGDVSSGNVRRDMSVGLVSGRTTVRESPVIGQYFFSR